MSINDSIEQDLQNEGEFNLADTLGTYIKQWHWILLSVLIFMSVSYFYVKSRIPVYKISTSLLIKDNTVSSDKDVLAQLNLNPSNVVLDNEIQILKSDPISQRAVESLELQNSYFVEGNFSKRILYKNVPLKVILSWPSNLAYGMDWSVKFLDSKYGLFNGKKIELNRFTKTDAGIIKLVAMPNVSFNEVYFVSFRRIESLGGFYAAKLAITPVSKSGTVLAISTEDEVPQRGRDYLNQLISEYNKAGLEDKNRNISNTLSFIDGRLKELVVELGQTEKDVVDYRSSNNITDISAQSQVYLGTVASNDAQLAKIDLQLSTLSNIENYLEYSDNSQVKLPSLLGMEDPTIATLIQRLGDAQLRKQSLLRTIPETNPIVSSISDQITSLKVTISETLKNVRSGLLANQRQLRLQSKRYDDNIRDVPKRERGLLDVMRQQNIKNNLFNFLLQKREEAALSLASTISDSRTISPAQSSTFPIRPIKSSIYLAFFIVGLVLPIVIIFGIEALNNNIRKKADIDRITKVPILAQISKSSESDALITVSKPRSMVAEQIRGLRTNLQFIIPGQDTKVILFTSSVSGEGKSYMSLNLGASLASTNKKVVILELDLRKPKLLSTLGLEPNIGLSDYLIGNAGYDQIIRLIPQQENFFMIESGSIPPNPAELLVTGKLTELIDELKKSFDYILLDAPPVGLVTDAQILSRYADTTLYLVRYNYTRKTDIRLVNEINKRKIFSKLNIIFNSVDSSSFGYGYSYNYGYYENPTQKKSFFKKK